MTGRWELESRAALQELLREVGIVPDRRAASEMQPPLLPSFTIARHDPGTDLIDSARYAYGPGSGSAVAGPVTMSDPLGVSRMMLGGTDVTLGVKSARLMRGALPVGVTVDEFPNAAEAIARFDLLGREVTVTGTVSREAAEEILREAGFDL